MQWCNPISNTRTVKVTREILGQGMMEKGSVRITSSLEIKTDYLKLTQNSKNNLIRRYALKMQLKSEKKFFFNQFHD